MIRVKKMISLVRSIENYRAGANEIIPAYIESSCFSHSHPTLDEHAQSLFETPIVRDSSHLRLLVSVAQHILSQRN